MAETQVRRSANCEFGGLEQKPHASPEPYHHDNHGLGASLQAAMTMMTMVNHDDDSKDGSSLGCKVSREHKESHRAAEPFRQFTSREYPGIASQHRLGRPLTGLQELQARLRCGG